MQLNQLVNKLDQIFSITELGADGSFSRFIPMVYDAIEYPWKKEFEPSFTTYFNGLMIRGADEVNNLFLAVFPTDSVLERFIHEAKPGDMLFMHHPIVMECGNPRGEWGRGFIPIEKRYIDSMKEKKLSVYTCHIPLDVHKQLGTGVAIAKALNVNITDWFLQDDAGEFGIIGELPTVSTNCLIQTLEGIFDIPFVDFEGRNLESIEKIAIVPGCGDKVQWMKEAEAKGVHAYITGEIHCHIDNEYGKKRYKEMKDYTKETSMALIGVSHSASEYLVKKTLLKDWFEQHFALPVVLLPQDKWWL